MSAPMMTDIETVRRYLEAFESEMVRKVEEPTHNGPEFQALSRIKQALEAAKDVVQMQAEGGIAWLGRDPYRALREALGALDG